MLRDEDNQQRRHPSRLNRISERQKIVVEALNHYYAFGETLYGDNAVAGRAVDLSIAIMLLTRLAQRRGDAMPKICLEKLSEYSDAVIKKLEREALYPEEANFMILRLAERLMRTGTEDILGRKYIKESIRHSIPQKK